MGAAIVVVVANFKKRHSENPNW